MRLVLVLVLLLAACGGGDGGAAGEGVVVHVVDGDTVDVRLEGGRVERVRVLGIDTPERGECWFRRSTAEARQLADGRRVELRADPTQARRDRFDRLLAYVDLEGGGDLGLELLAGGHARVLVFAGPFERLDEYREAEERGRARGALWRHC